ncbi:hypothetical protein H5410_014726 [Solanum commersonii]|uniref:Uncharacterized protein n=1 Tax=Solanum commersonii TaxID=4109 RepID=A0A9J5ZRR7_SOLCO|nr:hypothetical protein H5410_014726 [Solanum commersonii]
MTYTISQSLDASSVACAHRLNDIGYGLHASANGRRHRPRPARNNRGVCASAGRHQHWPMASGNNQVNDIDQRHAAAAKACTHHPRVCARSAGRHRLKALAGGINQGLEASDVACVHLANGVGQWQATTANVGPHHPCPAHIGQPTSGVAYPYLPRPTHNGVSGRPTWPAHIAFGLHTMISRCRTWAATIGCG